MRKFIWIICVLAAATGYVEGKKCAADDEKRFSFHGPHNGPTQWPTLFPMYCAGQSQSPIDIAEENVKSTKRPRLHLVNYDIAITKATVLNNGVTIQVIPTDGVERSITVNNTKYTLVGLRTHWGKLGQSGSAHSINNVKTLMEVDFIHTDENDNKAGLVSLINKNDESTFFNPITEVLPEVTYLNKTTELKSPLKLSEFFPPSPIRFFRYRGSRMRPNCDEVFVWTISKTIAYINSAAFKALDKIYTVTEEQKSDDCKMAGNFRPRQNLNGRPIYVSK